MPSEEKKLIVLVRRLGAGNQLIFEPRPSPIEGLKPAGKCRLPQFLAYREEWPEISLDNGFVSSETIPYEQLQVVSQIAGMKTLYVEGDTSVVDSFVTVP